MPRWQPFDVVGGAYSDDTRPWTVQDTVNYLVVNAERPGGRSNKMLRGVPGMVTFSASMPESSVRGLYVAEGRLFAVVGTTLYRIATDGSATSLGAIPGVGRCVFTHNQVSGGNQVVIGNGQSGYVFNTTDDTLVQITDEAFPGIRSVDFADQQIVGVEPFGRYWYQSDLAGAVSYNSLDRNEAEKAPDRIMQLIVTGPDILVLGERTLQFFYNTGEDTGTWSNRSGAEQDVGAASPWTACRLDNTVYWLGNDGSVYRLNGYVPQRISTHALEQAISRCTLADAYAFTFEDQGHKCYLLTFPDGHTWCFDAATQEWTRRESYGFNRWRISALVKWGRNWIAGDFINGKLYQLDWRVQQEAGEPLERRRITGVLHDDQNRMIVNAAEFVFDTGMDQESVPLPQPIIQGLSITGDVPHGLVGSTGSGQYTVVGGIAPRTVTVLSGTIPPGLTVNTDGTYSYNYTTAGSYAWVVQVTDANGDTATVSDTAEVGTSYSAWNPADKTADAILSDSNRVLSTTTSGVWAGVRSVAKKSTGKWYVEFPVTMVSQTAGWNRVGVCVGSAALGNSIGTAGFGVHRAWAGWFNVINSTDARGYSEAGQLDGTNEFNYLYGEWIDTTSDPSSVRVHLAIDFDAGKLWFRIVPDNETSRQWAGPTDGTFGNPATGTNPTFTFTPNTEFYLFAQCQYAAVDNQSKMGLATNPSEYVHTAPSGYSAGWTD